MAVPILMYHVIRPAPPGAPFPALYVPPREFAAQMHALKSAGWTAVTLDQVWDAWTRAVALPPGRPIVVSFDNGYESQFNEAMPVLRRLHWVGVVAAVRAAGYRGSTTVVPGWSRRTSDPFRLPRLRVIGGTSPQALQRQIAGARHHGAPPPTYSGA